MKKILILAFLVLSFSIFSVVKNGLHSYLVENTMVPFQNEKIHIKLSLLQTWNDDTSRVMIEGADKTDVNIAIHPHDDQYNRVVWYMTDDKYFDNLRGLNKPISKDEFNNINTYIDSNTTDNEFYFNYLNHHEPYRLMHLKSFNEDKTMIMLSADSMDEINYFQDYLKTKNIESNIIEMDFPQDNMFTYFNKIMFSNPLMLISTMLVIVSGMSTLKWTNFI